MINPNKLMTDDESNLEIDCCQFKKDPLLGGRAKFDCLIATIMSIIAILLFVIGILLTLLHYVAFIEFNCPNKGKIVGPVLLGLVPIPLLFAFYFTWIAKQKVSKDISTMKHNYLVQKRIMYKNYQVGLNNKILNCFYFVYIYIYNLKLIYCYY